MRVVMPYSWFSFSSCPYRGAYTVTMLYVSSGVTYFTFMILSDTLSVTITLPR